MRQGEESERLRFTQTLSSCLLAHPLYTLAIREKGISYLVTQLF